MTKRNPNYLPELLGNSFEEALDSLVESLASTEGFKGEYLLSEYKSKYLGDNTRPASERRAAAIHKWLAVEDRNRTTNERLFYNSPDFAWCPYDTLISRIRRIIHDVLGPCVESSLYGGSHTNGASTRVRRSPAAALHKHTGKAHVTPSALPHWSRLSEGTILEDQEVELVSGSVLFTVDKSTSIDRVAAKEPEINMLLQRIVGTHIRRRLLTCGINLNDQTVNQKLAQQAVASNLATIDLSSASDSITKQLVILLLPFDWWSLLEDLRVKSINIDGSEHEPEMFSSMGNGFTFELESLLFYAITRAVCWSSGTKGKISVYGDDIIAPNMVVPRLIRVFSWFGFTVNQKKSHWTGRFRESCGKHYYGEVDVTPFYLRAPVRHKTDLIRVLNRLLQWDGGTWRCITHPEILRFHYKWAKHIPEQFCGGLDPERETSLVTGRRLKHRKMIVPVLQPLEFPPSGGYHHWLTVSEALEYWSVHSDREPLSVTPMATTNRFRAIRDRSWDVNGITWDPYLLLEIDSRMQL